MPILHPLIIELIIPGIAAIATLMAMLFGSAHHRARRERDALSARLDRLRQTLSAQAIELESLARFRDVRDAAQLAERLRQTAKDLHDGAHAKARQIQAAAEHAASAIVADAEREAKVILDAAKEAVAELRANASHDARARRELADTLLTDASEQAERIIATAKREAETIAGAACRALQDTGRTRTTGMEIA